MADSRNEPQHISASDAPSPSSAGGSNLSNNHIQIQSLPESPGPLVLHQEPNVNRNISTSPVDLSRVDKRPTENDREVATGGGGPPDGSTSELEMSTAHRFHREITMCQTQSETNEQLELHFTIDVSYFIVSL